MTTKPVFIGNSKANFESSQVKGSFVNYKNEVFYKITNIDNLRPFLMSIVSDSNHWMFISSNGGLTAGRKNSEAALFPYYTDDKITESAEITGSKTILQVHLKNKTFLWEPFSDKYTGLYNLSRNLYKNVYGNKVVFEEINHDLGVTFRYEWNSSNLFGFVKKSSIQNNTINPIQITVLDGIQNIIPYGVSADLQNAASNLVDAYKKNELYPEVGLGIFALSAIIVDKPEPSEALKSTIVWSVGVKNPTYLLSALQLNDFRKGKKIRQETDVKAEKGAYFTCSDIDLKANTIQNWLLVANVNQSITSITSIIDKIKNEKDLFSLVQKDIEAGTKHLLVLNGAADGIQITADVLRNTRHFSNSLFNIMRGGIFDNNYQIEKGDFIKYIKNANKKLYSFYKELLHSLPLAFNADWLKDSISRVNDNDFERLCIEYMPLKFSRRHGDPSRPWNKFSINTQSEIDGSKILDYEGNWRDIFQNWEALAHSYPAFIESMIFKFLNATTFDGYNPYRITKDGFDWEVIDEKDPWSYIGYWGDHQIIYLLKFLEFIENYYPNKLVDYFDHDLFVYANVPYKIKGYADILTNPKDTIEFDNELHENIVQIKNELGADGALLRDKKNNIYKVNLIEKLLATVLAKVSNFIPETGIWLNTQRPEWNDANNALVGNGVSMVTLYYLRRFLKFFENIISKTSIQSINISKELAAFFDEVMTTLKENEYLLKEKISNTDRKTVLDGLGNAGSSYRLGIYNNGFSNTKRLISQNDLLNFTKTTLQFLDHSIKASKRTDNLYHSYNLMSIENDTEVSLSYLPEMLEGQVAILSSGFLSATESIKVLNSLKNSALYREDQYSYILYPNKELARFNKKNNIPNKQFKKSSLLKKLVKDGNTQIILKDCVGNYHFNGNFNNAKSLKNALTQLPSEKYQEHIEKDEELLLDIFEKIFDHKSFTGRSGTFFGYEGLGSIYWHMVSKLLLAVQETYQRAIENKESGVLIGQLLDHYHEINEGIGVHKSPELYGAFPTDPYSHTPAGKGAQQPGMTGQVKEDVLSRFGELGVFVKNGMLHFQPSMLKTAEFLSETKTFIYIDIQKQEKVIELEKDSLCFTYCQVPVIYKLSKENAMKVVFNKRENIESQSLHLDKNTSKLLFERKGEIEHIIVCIKSNMLS